MIITIQLTTGTDARR